MAVSGGAAGTCSVPLTRTCALQLVLQLKPDKNEYSHPVEALEYALQGEGEGRQALRREGGFLKPHTAKANFNVFG